MKQGTKLGSQKGRWIILAALVVVLGALLYLLPGGLAQAQQAQQSFTYAENGNRAGGDLLGHRPGGRHPIVWSLLEDAANEQNLGIFIDSNTDGDDDSDDDVAPADVIDFGDFSISQDGVLTFASRPDFEDRDGGQLDENEANPGTGSNTYQVVVQASDGGVRSFVNWFKVTVNVTDLEEDPGCWRSGPLTPMAWRPPFRVLACCCSSSLRPS